MARRRDDHLRLQERIHDAVQPLTYAVATIARIRRREERGEPIADRASLLRQVEDAIEASAKQLRAALADDIPGGPGASDRHPRRHEISELVSQAIVYLPDDQLARVRIFRESPLAAGDWDGAEVTQILRNLIDNALKYSPPDSPVDVIFSAQQDCVIVDVRDRGAGLTETEIRSIFYRFYRSPRVRSAAPPGTGLGLASCRALAELNGGRIEVTSDGPGRGATFRLVLPRRVLEASAPLERHPPLSRGTGGPDRADVEESSAHAS